MFLTLESMLFPTGLRFSTIGLVPPQGLSRNPETFWGTQKLYLNFNNMSLVPVLLSFWQQWAPGNIWSSLMSQAQAQNWIKRTALLTPTKVFLLSLIDRISLIVMFLLMLWEMKTHAASSFFFFVQCYYNKSVSNQPLYLNTVPYALILIYVCDRNGKCLSKPSTHSSCWHLLKGISLKENVWCWTWI